MIAYPFETLEYLFETWHKEPAWLQRLSEIFAFDAESESILERLDSARRRAIKELEAAWHDSRKNLLKPEPESTEWAKERRKEFLDAETAQLGQEVSKTYSEYEQSSRADEPLVDRLLILHGVDQKEKVLSQRLRELQSITHCSDGKGIDQSKIDRAREYPLDRLVEAVKGFIICPLHQDSKPSMWIKNGFGYCFVCTGSLDSIGYLMKVKGLTFPAAVEALQ